MFKFACKDVGMDCTFVATGNTVEEVKEAAFAHAGVVHKDVMQSMTPEQLEGLAKTVEEKIQAA
jgi:predicted small metal-binding protein